MFMPFISLAPHEPSIAQRDLGYHSGRNYMGHGVISALETVLVHSQIQHSYRTILSQRGLSDN
jgi:hypothetical protein